MKLNLSIQNKFNEIEIKGLEVEVGVAETCQLSITGVILVSMVKLVSTVIYVTV